MTLAKEQIKHLAQLSRLDLDERQIANLGTDLEHMMDMAQHVQEMDLANMEGIVHIHDGDQPMREDKERVPQANLSTAAAANQDGFVLVPKVLP